jgi:hypothetical protein
VDRLPSRRVATSVCILCLRCWRAGSTDGFPGSFGGFLTRLLKVSIISPQVGSILATVHEDAAGPSRPYTCDHVSNLTLQEDDGAGTNLEGPSSPGIEAVRSGL